MEDAETILRHWNNYNLRQYLPTPLPTSLEDMKAYIQSANESYTKRSGFTFGIESKETGKLVGLVNLANISWMSRSGEIGILGILDPSVWGEGFGSDALIVLLDFAYSVLDMHSVYLWVASFNERAIRFYEKIGFKNQGKIREMAYRNGERHDVVVMDILKSEFVERYGILPKGTKS
ncbi:MAG: GNAT family N-acetyltransferase [Candidatus Thorarchaeota archaeon]|nr:MAG: GNAT family N-acetyltransferase [Candidatus Thorarchaeota archaeon]